MTKRMIIGNARSRQADRRRFPAFTLIELLVVISIISLLISILLPSMSRAREQAKSVHCLARLKEFGTAIATYEITSDGVLPPPLWFPSAADQDAPAELRPPPQSGEHTVEYGWTEILFAHVYGEKVRVPESYPVQRNVDGHRWEGYFRCKAVGEDGVDSGHYRVYLPAWSGSTFTATTGNGFGNSAPTMSGSRATALRGGARDRIRPKLPLLGDANELSERGDGFGEDDCSYIDAGEANYAGSDGRSNGNRFSDRHYGGTNYLFADLHAVWDTRLREELARDFDRDGVDDVDVQP